MYVVNGIGHGVGFDAWGCSARWLSFGYRDETA